MDLRTGGMVGGVQLTEMPANVRNIKEGIAISESALKNRSEITRVLN